MTGLLLLVQALAKTVANDARVALLVVSSGSRIVDAGDDLVPWRAPVHGFMKTVLQEYPNLTGHHLDLPESVNDDSVTQVALELRTASTEPIVAYRSGVRLIPRFERVAFDQESADIPFKAGGLYVVAGGLGGIGANVCRYLQAEFAARLAILGRSAPDKVSGALVGLEGSGSAVIYKQADIRDSRETRRAVEDIEAHFGTTIDGIIHAAGQFTERPLPDETPASFAAPLAERVQGALALAKIADERPGSLLVVFSSVNGFFGGASTAAYSSAHSAVDEIMHARIRRGSASYSFAWTVWDETGMARGYLQKELSRSLGFQVLTARTAMQAFKWALQSPARQVWIGLDESSPIVSRHVEGKCQPLTRPKVYYSGSESTTLDAVSVKDHFGREIQAAAVKLPAEHLLPDGTLDLKNLASREGRQSAVAQPETELEALIAGIWTSLLGVDHIDVNDSFFDFGGTSISVAQVSGQLSKVLNRSIPVTTFYRHPSVKALASALAEDNIDGTLEQPSRGDHRRQKMLKRRRSLPSSQRPQP
jgi:NAD(P)-dependent dehydrogenase (short-subunit alcohol dehydrogenase family)